MAAVPLRVILGFRMGDGVPDGSAEFAKRGIEDSLGFLIPQLAAWHAEQR